MFALCFNFEASCAPSQRPAIHRTFVSVAVCCGAWFPLFFDLYHLEREQATSNTFRVELAMEKRTNTEEERWRRNSNVVRKLLVVASARPQLTKGDETRSSDSNGERHRLKWRSYRANRASRVTTCGAERESDIEIPSRKASSLVDFRKL